MSFAIPKDRLDDEIKLKIRKDLLLKERGQVYGAPKEFKFYTVENGKVHLPLEYAQSVMERWRANRRFTWKECAPFDFNGELRDYQKGVLEEAEANYSKGTNMFNVFCGFGKTVMAAYYAAEFSKLGLRTLIVYPLKIIQKSWIGTFKDLTDAKIYVVGETKGPLDDSYQVVLSMKGRLSKIEEKWKIGHFVMDEAHMLCTERCVPDLLSFTPLLLTGLTATYERDDGFHSMLDLMFGNRRIIRKNDKPFDIFKFNTGIEPVATYNAQGMVQIWDVVKSLDQNDERNEMIVGMVERNIDRKILILTRHVDHVTLLHELLTERLPDKVISRLAGKDKGYEDGNVLIGTFSKCGTGFDEKEACDFWNGIRLDMLLFVATTKKTEQFSGRVMRSDFPIIVDFVDNFKNCHAHWNVRRKWYLSRNGKIGTASEDFKYGE